MAEKSLRLRVILDLADKALAPLKRMDKASKETAGALKAAREQLKQLNATQKTLGSFTEARKGLGDIEAKLQAANEKVRQLATTMGSAGPPSKAMAQQFAAARTEAAKLGAQFTAERQRVQQLRDKLGEAGISTKNLASHDMQLRSSIASTTANIQRQTEALKRQSDEQRKLARIQQQSAKAAAIGGGVAAAGAVGVYAGKRTVQTAVKPVQSYMAHEDAMLGIARQVPGARDEAGQLTAVYSGIEAQVRELSKHVPLATTQIAEMFTAAARMEVPTDKLSEFVLMASEMATAFDAVPDEITESMGKVAKNFKIELTNIRGLADAINYLDDNAISKGADIIDYLNRTSGVLATVAMSERNAAALGSTLLTLGERAETASTATNAIISKFAATTKGTKKFQSAVKEIGLSSQAIETGMTKDATGTLMKVMEAVRKAPESKRMGIMVELVGMEHSDTLAKLVDKPEELRRQIDLANSKQADGSMAREASARNQTMSAQGKMTDNRLFNLKAIVGESLKSEVQDLLAVVNPLLDRITAWTQANPALVGGLLKGVVVFGALLAAASALLIPLGLLVAKGFLVRLMLAKLAGVAAGGAAFGGMATGAGRLLPLLARLALGFLRMLGPVGLLITSGWMVYSNWADIVGGAKLLWEDLGNWLGGIWASIVNTGAMLWQGFLGALGGIWSMLSSLFMGTLQQIATISDSVWQGIIGTAVGIWMGFIANLSSIWALIQTTASMAWQGMATMFSSFGGWIIDGLIGGITGKLGQLRDTVVGAASSAAQWFKEKLGINSPSRVFTQFGGWISEGAALGIEGGQATVRAAALTMAASAMVPAANASPQPPAMPVVPAMAAQMEVMPKLGALPSHLPAATMQANPVPAAVPQLPAVAAKMAVMPTLGALPGRLPAATLQANPMPAAVPQLPSMAAKMAVTPTLGALPGQLPAATLQANPMPTVVPQLPSMAAKMAVMLTLGDLPSQLPAASLQANPVPAAVPQLPSMAAKMAVMPKLGALPSQLPAATMQANPVPAAVPKLPPMAAQMAVMPSLGALPADALALPREHQISVRLLGLEQLQGLPQVQGVNLQGQSGDAEPIQAQPVPRIQRGTAIASRPAVAPTPAGNSTYTITINPAPGMDPQAIARAVAAELDRREQQAGARRRSATYDLN
ncbi:phage tail tape measure protein [Comamonas testosteroni]|uniref:phage tail tape measure protein n=1 Tax=Comamonas testosteroni TaxID=285 RepID=UPI002DBA19E6|nr:phage tail tape measure protein [Comamonas testosteroni]MEB5967337.1 phage tail tape measure protein [Comamonas testosteroni]